MASPTVKAKLAEIMRHPENIGKPKSFLRRQARAALQNRTIDPIEAARRRVSEAELARIKEHERSSVIPKRVMRRSQIELLFEAGSLVERQKRAADKIMALYEASGFEGRVVANYEASIGGGGMMGSGPKAREYMQAMQAIPMALSGVLVAVVFLNQSPGMWARSKGQDRREGMPLLKAALDTLADHFEGARPKS